MTLDVRVSGQDLGGTLHVDVTGDFDIASEASFLACITSLASSHRFTQIVLDLSRVTFIDSSGLQALLNAQAVARVAGSWIVLSGPTRAVSRVLDLTETRRDSRLINEVAGLS